jgi:hypothetical protein
METKFGEDPIIRTSLKVNHKDELIYHSESELQNWYEGLSTNEPPPSLVDHSSIAVGYQYKSSIGRCSRLENTVYP